MTKVKAWGLTWPVFIGKGVEVHRLNMCPGGFSSEHRHRVKTNDFYLLSGSVTIRVGLGGGQWQEFKMPSGRTALMVEAGDWHQLVAGPEGCELLEVVFWQANVEEPKGEDIERRTEGGCNCGGGACRVEPKGSPMLCNHANEVPHFCPCGADCYCRGKTCPVVAIAQRVRASER